MFLLDFIGRYGGINNLILSPAEPPFFAGHCDHHPGLARKARAPRLHMGRRRSAGRLAAGWCTGRAHGVLAAWTDSWHMGDKLMVCCGDIDTTAHQVLSTCTAIGAGAPPGADWGWRIVITRAEGDSFILR